MIYWRGACQIGFYKSGHLQNESSLQDYAMWFPQQTTFAKWIYNALFAAYSAASATFDLKFGSNASTVCC